MALVSWRWSGPSRKAGLSGRASHSTAPTRPVAVIIPGKMSFRPGCGKRERALIRPDRLGKLRFSPDQAGKTETPPGEQHPERIEPRHRGQYRGAGGDESCGHGPIGG